MLKIFKRTPQWKLNAAAKDRFVSDVMFSEYGEELLRRFSARNPNVDEKFVELHVKLELEKLFHKALWHAKVN